MIEQIQTIGAEYNALINQGSTMRERVAVMIVDSQESKVQAADVLASIVTTRKSLEKDKETIYRPIKDALDEVNRRYKGPLEAIDALEKTIRSKIQTYDAEQYRIAQEKADRERKEREAALAKEMEEKERQRKEQEERIRAEATRQAELAAANGDTAKAETIKTQAENVIGIIHSEQDAATLNQIDGLGEIKAEAPKAVVTASGASTSTVMVWDFEVADQHAVPDEFVKWEIKRAEVLKRLRETNGQPISGLKVFQRAQTRVNV